MKLFKTEVQFRRVRRGRQGVDVIVHARSIAAAKELLAKKYTGAKIGEPIVLAGPKHFVIADLVA